MSLSFSNFRFHWRITVLLALGGAINYADRSALSSVLPALQNDLGLSDVGLGVLGSLFLWTYAIGSPIAGFLADRFSRSRMVIVSLALWSLITGLTGFANGLIALCVLRAALGISECVYIPAAISLLGDYHTPSTRARGISTLIGGISLGVVAGGAIAGLLANYYGWRLVFWVFGAGGLAFAMILRGYIVDPAVTAETTTQRPRITEVLGYLIRIPSYLILLTKVMLVSVGAWMFFNWLPLYFYETFQMNLGSAGFVGTSLPEFSALLGIAAGAWISDKVAAHNVHRRMLLQGLSYLAASPVLLVFLGRPSFAGIAVALFSFSFIRGIGDANEQAILCEIVPSRFRSTAVGIMNTCGTMAGGLGVILAGLLKQKFGLNIVFAATSGLCAIAAAALIFGYYIFVARDIAHSREQL